jgi:hypothetical protein
MYGNAGYLELKDYMTPEAAEKSAQTIGTVYEEWRESGERHQERFCRASSHSTMDSGNPGTIKKAY